MSSECRVCGARVDRVLDLGHHPLADRFLPPVALEEPETLYPLALDRCGRCGYVGLAHVVSPEDRYQAVEYSYTAGNSPVSVAHFGELAAAMIARCGLGKDDLVVDVGGNDGTLLAAVRAASGAQVLNVEPSSVWIDSKRAHIPTLNTFWDRELVSNKSVAAIACTNTFNHVSDLHWFLHAVELALRPGGWFVFEVPSLAEMLRRGSFDTIYLEHVSYFDVGALVELLSGHDLGIVAVEPIDYMGGSLRVWARLGMSCAAAVKREMIDGRAFDHLATSARRCRVEITRRLCALAEAGRPAFAIGAAAKGNTLLNVCRVDRSILSCVVDASPKKIGKVTPGTHLPIVGDAGIPVGAGAALILPWNIADHLVAKYKHLGVEFVVPPMGIAP